MTAVDLNVGDRFAPADRRRAQWLYADLCLRDKEMLIQTEHGRRAGWYVLLNDRYVCSLSYYSRPDQLWDEYEVVAAIDGNDVANDAFWHGEHRLRFACRANPQFEILRAECRWDDKTQRVMARGLFIPFQTTPVDRVALAMRRLYLEMRSPDDD